METTNDTKGAAAYADSLMSAAVGRRMECETRPACEGSLLLNYYFTGRRSVCLTLAMPYREGDPVVATLWQDGRLAEMDETTLEDFCRDVAPRI